MNQSTTAFSGDGNTTTANQASGQSIFWAFAAIAINSMLQPSVTGYIWSKANFENSLWPQRSSPFVCAMDALVEVLGARSTSEDRQEANRQYLQPTNRGAVTLRLVIFCLGVLPQVIKLFSMRGIPTTQVIAATFLVSAIPGMLRGLRSIRPTKHAATLAKRLCGTVSDGRRTKNDEEAMLALTVIVGFAPQIVVTAHTWQRLGEDIKLPLPVDIINLLDWISLFTAVAWIFVVPFVSLAGGFRMIKPSSILLPLICCSFLAGFSKIKSPDKAINRFSDAGSKYAFVSLLSFVVAYVLYISASCLRPHAHGEMEGSGHDVELPLTRQEGTDTGSEGDGMPPARQYTNAGTQTLPSAEYVTSAGSDYPYIAEGTTSTADATTKPRPMEEATLEPWQVLFLYFIGQFEAKDAVSSHKRPRVKDRACQTGSEPDDLSTSSSIEETVQSETPYSLIWHVFLPVRWLTKSVLTLYWEVLMLRAKPVDSEVQAPKSILTFRRERKSPRPTWKTMLLYVVWAFMKFISAYMGLYRHGARAIGGVLAIHNGDVMWIAFAITNFATAAVYYLVVFDGKGTYSPSWVAILG